MLIATLLPQVTVAQFFGSSLGDMATCSLQSMFQSAFAFNNGQFNTLLNVNPLLASFGSSQLTCSNQTGWPAVAFDATYNGKTIYIVTSTLTYSVVVSTAASANVLNVSAITGVSTIAAGNIYNILFSTNVAGTAPLNWKTDKVTTVENMFNIARVFNQKVKTEGLYWKTPFVTTYKNMFGNAYSFNNGNVLAGGNVFFILGLPDASIATIDVSSMLTTCRTFNQDMNGFSVSKASTMANMMQAMTNFNNGESGLSTLTGDVITATYATSGSTLTMNNASFTTQLVAGDVVVIKTSTIVFSSEVTTVNSAILISLTRTFGSNTNTNAPAITGVFKQLPGTKPLT